jgi:hypothetical protein
MLAMGAVDLGGGVFLAAVAGRNVGGRSNLCSLVLKRGVRRSSEYHSSTFHGPRSWLPIRPQILSCHLIYFSTFRTLS